MRGSSAIGGPAPGVEKTTHVASLVWIGMLLAVLLAVAIALRVTAARAVAPYVPLWADQVQYLTEAYRGYLSIQAHGPLLGTIEAVRQPRPQGWLLQTLASLHMQAVGPTRVAALDVNLAALLLWLGVTSAVVRRMFGISASLVALGLMLSAAVLLNHPGGPFDFRLDFATLCLWGTLLALLAGSNGRFRWGTTVAVLLVGSMLIATRFIAIFYLLPFGAAVILLAIVTQWRARRGWRRLSSWLIPVLAVWTVLGAATLALNYELFLGYYVWGHVTGGEVPIRRLEAGLSTLRDDLVYYPRVVLWHHLTRSFDHPALATLVVSAVAGLMLVWHLASRTKARRSAVCSAPRPSRPAVWWFLAVSTLGLLVTYGTLTVAQVKSPVVAGPLIPPLMLGVVGSAVWLGRASWDDHPVALARWGLRLLGPAIIVVALVSQWQRIESGPPGFPPPLTLAAYAQIVDDVTPYLRGAGERPLVWSMDGHYVHLASTTVQVLLYERTGAWLNLHGGLGHGALFDRLEEADLRRHASSSDVLILARHPPGTRLSYPYDQSVLDQHAVLERYAEEHLTLVNRYEIEGLPYFLYVRWPAPVGAPRS